MNTALIRFENDKVIHVASGSENADKKYIEEKAKKFDETNRRLQEAIEKIKR